MFPSAGQSEYGSFRSIFLFLGTCKKTDVRTLTYFLRIAMPLRERESRAELRGERSPMRAHQWWRSCRGAQ